MGENSTSGFTRGGICTRVVYSSVSGVNDASWIGGHKTLMRNSRAPSTVNYSVRGGFEKAATCESRNIDVEWVVAQKNQDDHRISAPSPRTNSGCISPRSGICLLLQSVADTDQSASHPSYRSDSHPPVMHVPSLITSEVFTLRSSSLHSHVRVGFVACVATILHQGSPERAANMGGIPGGAMCLQTRSCRIVCRLGLVAPGLVLNVRTTKLNAHHWLRCALVASRDAAGPMASGTA
ncbi:hypothetical protein BKA93DRAFT_320432 [Sparassis latifolia]